MTLTRRESNNRMNVGVVLRTSREHFGTSTIANGFSVNGEFIEALGNRFICYLRGSEANQ